MEPTNIGYSDNEYTRQPKTNTKVHMDALSLLRGEAVNRELDELYSSNCTLKKGIPITLRYEDQSYIIIQENLNLGADAPTLQDAERNLSSQIVRLYERLSSLDEAQLGPYPQELLVYLKEFIQ